MEPLIAVGFDTFLNILYVAIGLTFVILFHELGHFAVAKWCNVQVERFSIGFGPAIFSWKRGETDFTLGPIPFGGFVQINGMTIADEVDPDDERAYPNRPVWQRFLTIFAGPGTNYLEPRASEKIVDRLVEMAEELKP